MRFCTNRSWTSYEPWTIYPCWRFDEVTKSKFSSTQIHHLKREQSCHKVYPKPKVNRTNYEMIDTRREKTTKVLARCDQELDHNKQGQNYIYLGRISRSWHWGIDSPNIPANEVSTWRLQNKGYDWLTDEQRNVDGKNEMKRRGKFPNRGFHERKPHSDQFDEQFDHTVHSSWYNLSMPTFSNLHHRTQTAETKC